MVTVGLLPDVRGDRDEVKVDKGPGAEGKAHLRAWGWREPGTFEKPVSY